MIDFDVLMKTDVEAATYDVPVLFDEEGEGTAFLTIVGKNSDEYIAINRQIRADGMQRGAKRKTHMDASTPEGASRISALVDENVQKIALAVVVGWRGFALNGEPAVFSKESVAALLKKFPTWCDRVHVALENDANFLKV